MIDFHMSFGILILVLLIFRFVVRMAARRPEWALLLALIGLHVAAALYHQSYRKDKDYRNWGCERANARSHPQLRGLTTEIPREPK
jgi:cytochrome b561